MHRKLNSKSSERFIMAFSTTTLHSRAVTLFLCAMVLRSISSQHHDTVTAQCGDTVSLPCRAIERSSSYRTATWYKMNSTHQTGILRKASSKVTPYILFNRKASLGEREALVLSDVRPGDSGMYQCYLSAQLGGTNQQTSIHLEVQECVTALSTSPVQWVSSATLSPSGNTTARCELQVTEVSISMLVVGFAGVGLIKVVLSVCITVGCLGVLERRKERYDRCHCCR
ncbi:uncharacterized protein LOC131702176 [Acipenser ruthenus]|uniref:uncharacterized protein LOC131702176 n=1 Tax=Acipenser ruthenus TaxID=7906 RepID=UPI00145B9214|nr:uncharacterized protein LOC131702176 [Acipenser ruthenus]